MNQNIVDLMRCLSMGKENAETAEDLGRKTGMSQRTLCRTVHEARSAGIIVCSSCYGYYIPSCPEEILEVYDRLWIQSVSLLSSMKAMRRELKKAGLLDQTKEVKSRKKGKKEG